MMKRTSWFRRPLLALAFFAASKAQTRRAEACTVLPEPTAEGVLAVGTREHVIVGPDGFFTLSAHARNVMPNAAFEAIEVEVTDMHGDRIPGSTKLLHQEFTPNYAWVRVMAGWETSEPLEPGTTLLARMRSTNSEYTAESQTALTVSSERAVPTLPNLRFENWADVVHGTGPELTCRGTTCGTTQFRQNRERVVSVSLRDDEPGLSRPVVAWEISVQAIDGKGSFAEPIPPARIVSEDGTEPAYILFETMFRELLHEYCVLLTLRDLRTDQRLTSTLCSAPQLPLTQRNADAVGFCDEAPPGFESRWCDRNPNDAACATHVADDLPPPLGVAGAGNTADSGSTAGANGDKADRVILTEAGCGCRTASGNERNRTVAFTALLALATALGVRRRLA
jgi:MYXO-CTERM domain-containing protein